MTTIVETVSFYRMFIYFKDIYITGQNLPRSSIIRAVSYITELVLRIFIYVSRNKFKLINMKLVVIYENVNGSKILNLKYKLLSLLFINDIFNFMLILFVCLKEAGSTAFEYSIIFVNDWALLSCVVPVLFCYYCSILISIFIEMKKKLFRMLEVDISNFYYMYDQYTDIINELNEILQPILFITFGTLFSWIFINTYIMIFITPVSN